MGMGLGFCQQGDGCTSPQRERAGLEQGSFLKLLVIAREGLNHELLTANTPGKQGTECLNPEGDLEI